MDPETPFEQIQTLLAGLDPEREEQGADKNPLTVDTLRIDRTAVVKFKKANDVRLRSYDEKLGLIFSFLSWIFNGVIFSIFI